MSAAERVPADGAADAALPSELLFREVNEQILMLDSEHHDQLELVCECGDDRCFDRLAVPPADYERVRLFPSRFVVKPRHVNGESERVVEDCGGFVIVEKTGAAAAAAISADPRMRLRSTDQRGSYQ